jgi:hypothetical protein
MNPRKLLDRLAGPHSSHPTAPKAVDTRLAAIAEGRVGHKPTAAHPFQHCFDGSHYRGHVAEGQYRGQPADRMQRNWIGPDGTIPCGQFIARTLAERAEHAAYLAARAAAA